MSLTLNQDGSAFVYDTSDRRKAEAMGLTMWSGDCRPGRYTYFTSRYHGSSPIADFNPYQVLSLFHEADDRAKVALMDAYITYTESFAESSAREFPAAAGLSYAPYQNAAIHYGLKRDNVLLGDEPGLGKTVEALGLARQRGAERLLIVVPAAVRLQWEREVRRWYPELSKTRVMLKTSDGYEPDASATILSYNALQNRSLLDELMKDRWDNLILDEAHYLKNHEAKRTKYVLGGWTASAEGLASRASTITALTGTPLPNRPKEIYPLARALDFSSIAEMSHQAFLNRFNPSFRTKAGFPIEKTINLEELQARLRSHFMIRRAKDSVLKDLPPEQYELTLIEPNGDIKRVLKAERLLDIDPNDPGTFLDEDGNIDGAIATVRREMGEAKIPRIVEHARGVIEGGVEKVVVFVYHRDVLAQVAEQLDDLGVTRIFGGQTPLARDRSRQQFVEDPDTHILVGQLLAAGTGIDGLQHVCDRVVFGEADWVPGNNEQCVDRLHRYGQKGHVLAEFLVAPGSLDERILGSAIRKMHDQNVALDKRLV